MKKYRSDILFLGLLVGAMALTVFGCGKKIPAIPSTPTITAKTETELRAATKKAADILEASSAIVAKASDIELDASARGLVPATIHAPINTGFIAFAKRHKAAVQWLREHPLADWNAIKGQIDPLIDDTRNLIESVQHAGPSLGERLAGYLGAALTIFLQLEQVGAFGGGL